MKKLIPKSTMTVPWALLLSLILIFSDSSCSKPNVGDIVRAHIQAVNTDDVEKNLTFFADDIVFEMDSYGKLSGKDQLRGLMESDVVNKARLTIDDIEVEGDTAIVKLREKNEIFRLLEIEDPPFVATFKFRNRFIEKVKLESPSESAKLWDEKYRPFAEWASQEHPEEFKRAETGGYSAENCRLYLSLLREWRDKKDTERLSAESKSIKLVNDWTDTWIKRDGRWQCVAGHSLEIAQK
jgi:hypothetical protein